MRSATIDRNTLETQISVTVNLDGTGERFFNTGLPFLEHMLHQVARHGLIDLTVNATGDLRRYGHAYVPLDEALSRVVIDFSGRPGLEYDVSLMNPAAGDFDAELFHEFFQGFVNHAKVTLHIDNLKGSNAHHQIETVFKAFGRALRMALETDPGMRGGTPSTKGSL